MAKKNRRKKVPRADRKKNQANEGVKLNKNYQKIGDDLNQSGAIANKYLDTTPLSQLDTNRSNEMHNALNNALALSDPMSGSYAGARSAESSDILSRLNSAANTAGNRSGQMSDFLSRMNEATAGYDSRELTALREQRRRELERGFESGRASLARSNQGANRTARGAQLMELSKNYAGTAGMLENDFFADAAQTKQDRLQAYGDVLGTQEQSEFDRGNVARTTYANTLGQYQSNEFDRGQVARDAYGNLLRNDELDRTEKQKINLGQEAASKAIRDAGVLGIMGIQDSRQQAKRQNKLLNKAYGNSGRSSSGGGGNNQYAAELNKLAEQYRA